jgi:hypothetical protein
MIVDNRLATAKLKIFYMIMLGMLFALTAFFVFDNDIIMIYPIVAIIFAYLFFVFRRSDCFYLEYAGNKITVRFYTAHPFFRKYKAIEIPKAYFFDYQIKTILFGYIQTIQFIVKTPKGRFNYPPISISLLNRKKKDALIKILNELKPV